MTFIMFFPVPNYRIFDWKKCATITTSYSNANYRQLTQCPTPAGLFWKIKNSKGTCAQNHPGWVDWEFPNQNEQKPLGHYLNNFISIGYISPAMPVHTLAHCGIESATSWKDTTSVRAIRSNDAVDVYYKGIQ